MPGKHECWCGRSDSGICVGLHKFSEEDYQKYLKNKDKSESEKMQEELEPLPVEIPQVYTEEAVNKIIKDFQNLLMEADNFPRDKDPNDYREFWSGLRGEGSSLLGLTNHLKELIDRKEKK